VAGLEVGDLRLRFGCGGAQGFEIGIRLHDRPLRRGELFAQRRLPFRLRSKRQRARDTGSQDAREPGCDRETCERVAGTVTSRRRGERRRRFTARDARDQ
jgi:hypothetical protein